jgi:lipopolysaccharide transport system ATP-binding protein
LKTLCSEPINHVSDKSIRQINNFQIDKLILMSDTVIRVENLGKKYILGHQKQERYTALRDVITNKVKSLGSLINPKEKVGNPAFEEFWALKDVSFDIKQGDRVGIIGRNGAGKSTLLKILSRITEPTKGSIKIKGRVASLLEVGTGFHPELTGRENIFLNGAILGMGKEEIKRKFDEIVAFAEVEKFLDTPVKRYSSGMYVRLAFAVAAHLEPEILIVDEVLAVGDAQFQKKCLGKMEDVGKEGRTVIFVSHNNSAVSTLCNRGIMMNKGSIAFDATIKETITYYSQQINANSVNNIITTNKNYPSIQFISINEEKLKDGVLEVNVGFDSPWVLDTPLIGIVVYNLMGLPLFGSNTWMDKGFKPIPMSKGIAKMSIREIPLHTGTYKISVWLGEKNQNYDFQLEALQFEFISSEMLLQGLSTDTIGSINLPSKWIVESN